MGIDIRFVIFGCITNSNTSNRLFNVESGYFIQNYRIIFWKKDNLKQAIYLPCVIRWTLQLPKDPLKKGGWKGEKTLEKKKGKDIRKKQEGKINLKKKERKNGTFLTNPSSKEFV